MFVTFKVALLHVSTANVWEGSSAFVAYLWGPMNKQQCNADLITFFSLRVTRITWGYFFAFSGNFFPSSKHAHFDGCHSLLSHNLDPRCSLLPRPWQICYRDRKSATKPLAGLYHTGTLPQALQVIPDRHVCVASWTSEPRALVLFTLTTCVWVWAPACTAALSQARPHWILLELHYQKKRSLIGIWVNPLKPTRHASKLCFCLTLSEETGCTLTIPFSDLDLLYALSQSQSPRKCCWPTFSPVNENC